MLCNIGLAMCRSSTSHNENKEPKTWLIKYFTDWLTRETEEAKKGCSEDQHRDERNERSQASLTHQCPGTSSQAHPSWTPWPFLQFLHLSGDRTPLLAFMPFRIYSGYTDKYFYAFALFSSSGEASSCVQ